MIFRQIIYWDARIGGACVWVASMWRMRVGSLDVWLVRVPHLLVMTWCIAMNQLPNISDQYFEVYQCAIVYKYAKHPKVKGVIIILYYVVFL